LEGLLGEYEMLDEAFEDLGGISGSVTLDIGTGGGSLVSYLVRRKGLERVFAIDLFTGTLGLLRQKLSSEEMLKVIVIKADLRRLDFLRDCFFDLVTAYDTLSVVELFTPGGTKYVLNEVHRILKPEGFFVIIEHLPIDLVKPIDEAQKVGARSWDMHIGLNKARGESSGVEYTPQSLAEIIGSSGFEVSHWKELAATYLEEFSESLIPTEKIQRILDEKLRKKFFQEAERIYRDAKKYGMRSIPHHVVYATKPASPERRETVIPELTELYDTIRHRDILGY